MGGNFEVVIYDLHDADFEELELGKPGCQITGSITRKNRLRKNDSLPKLRLKNPEYPELFYFFVGGFICW